MPEVTGSSPVSSTIQNAGVTHPAFGLSEVWARGAMRRELLILIASLTLSLAGVGGAAPISARDVLISLKTLHAGLATGLDYEGYHRQLIDAKNTFDRYAEGKVTTVPEASAKAAMAAAMNYHRFAQFLWATTLRRDGALPLSSFEELTILLEHFPCPALTSLVEAVTKRYADNRDQDERAKLVVDRASSDRAVRVLWSCASDRIAEAERIIGRAKP